MRMCIILLSLLMVSCRPGTPLGNVLHKPHDCHEEFQIDNNGSLPLVFQGSIREWASDMYCESPQYKEEELTIPSGGSKTLTLSLKCVSCGTRAHGKVTRPTGTNYATAYTRLSSPDADRIPVGFSFDVFHYGDLLSVQPMTVVAKLPTSSKATWPPAALYSPGNAWLEGNKLIAVVDNTFAAGRYLDIGFPLASGLSKFGNYEVRQQSGYYLSNFPYTSSNTITISTKDEAQRRYHVVCDDTGCTSTGDK